MIAERDQLAKQLELLSNQGHSVSSPGGATIAHTCADAGIAELASRQSNDLMNVRNERDKLADQLAVATHELDLLKSG